MKFYLDTNIWLDYFWNRSSGLIPLGEFAFQFLKKATESKSELYYSDLVLKELTNIIGEKDTNELINSYKEILVFICPTKQDVLEAKKLVELTKIHYADAFHAVLCNKVDAVLISRDKHFLELDFIKVLFPEEVTLY